MKHSIFSKIFLGHLLIISVFTVLTFTLSYRTVRNHYISYLTGSLTDVGTVLATQIQPLLYRKDYAGLNSLLMKTGTALGKRLTVIGPDGTVLADSERDPAGMDNHLSRPEVQEALRNKRGSALRYSTTVESDMLYVALPVLPQEGTPFILRISVFLEDIKALLDRIQKETAQVSVIVFVIALLGSIVISKNFSRPIRRLADSARNIASGNFDVHIDLDNRDEVGDLADSFNFMTAKIKMLFADLSFQTEETNNIISSIQEGLVIINQEGIIVRTNKSFGMLFPGVSGHGKHYWEVLREQHLITLLKQISANHTNFTEEIEFNGKHVLASGSYIASNRVIVLLLHDITEIRHLQQQKKDFVTNVSHELRTPLTAIKGFIETLEEEADDEQLRYVAIIRRHTDRLINIVQDLLTLSQVENAAILPVNEKVDVSAVIENVLKLFEARIAEKGLKLEVGLDHSVLLLGDAFKLEQIFINLIDNAIKYTEKGRIGITVTGSATECRIVIQDTGLGIPRDHISRIFERFYVVDKSRSRRLGGTGLGLAIVKHIVLLHNGTVSVDSSPGLGSTFTITLPQVA